MTAKHKTEREMTAKHDPEGEKAARRARPKSRGVVRFLAAMGVVVAVAMATSPQPADALSSPCGQGGEQECQSIGVCIDLWKLFTICFESYAYYAPE